MTTLCIIGGGASGVGLAWVLARAQQLGLGGQGWQITLLHDQPALGGHSFSVPVRTAKRSYAIDLGVQMIAPVMYPNLKTQLALPEFAPVALQPVDLKLSAAFPPANGATPYWGNFAAYQNTSLYQQGEGDCATFEKLLASLLRDLWDSGETLEAFLEGHSGRFKDLSFFESYFLDPYMSIMNGYGQALLDKVKLLDVWPLFKYGYARFTREGEGFARFRDGSSSWIEAMADQAKAQLGGSLEIVLGATATALCPGSEGPTVSWNDAGGSHQQGFDAVVSTLDMNGNSALLDNPTNQASGAWAFYAPYVGTVSQDGDDFTNSVWPLEPGFCYLHRDPTLLAPGLPSPPQEVLQFTGTWATQQQPYDITWTFTTYVERNLLGVTDDPEFVDYYLTMYGFDPTKARQQGIDVPVPDPGKVLRSMNWVHGMWLPTFMLPQKEAFANAQGVSRFAKPNPEQRDTRIFFAGNNLTMDSEEGAFVSALALAQYAFGIPSFDCIANGASVESAAAFGELLFFYELMFEMGGAQGGGGLAGWRRHLRQLEQLARVAGRTLG